MRKRGSLKLSVFTIGSKSASDCRMVVGELSRQTCVDALEVIVVAPDRDGIDDELVACFGAWQWVTLPTIGTCGVAMEAAVRRATAPFVTYAEEHSYFQKDWAHQLIAAHEKGYDAVGYAIENANPRTLTSWAHLYMQFGPLVAPAESRESNFLAGHHASYSRELLLEYKSALIAMLEDESAMFLDLHRRGRRMFIAGEAVSRHVNVSSLRSLVKIEYDGLRSFASTRASTGSWPWWKRTLYAGGAPLIPLVRMRRSLAHIWRTRRQGVLLPGILAPMSVALVAGAYGEAVGYLFGAGDSAEQKTPLELERERFLSHKDAWTKSGQSG